MPIPRDAIIPVDKPSVLIEPPEDLELRALWDLAVEVKGVPTTKADADALIAEYHAQLAKAPALTRHLVKEVAAPPVPPRQVAPAVELRDTLTPFAEQLAAVLEPTPENERGIRVRIITAAEAATVLPRLSERHGFTGKPFTYLRQADGRLTHGWTEAPSLWVREWASREGVILLKEDPSGPLELRFLTRISLDTAANVMRVGDAEYESREYFRALWDVGIREIHAEVRTELRDVVMTDVRRARLAAIPEVQMARRDRGDGWIEQITRLTARP